MKENDPTILVKLSLQDVRNLHRKPVLVITLPKWQDVKTCKKCGAETTFDSKGQ